MLETLLWLIGYLLIGETLCSVFHIPIPGSVIGMVLLFITLCIRRRIPNSLINGTQTILSHMSLFFVPTGVGVIAYTSMLKPFIVPLSFILISALLVTMLSTAFIFQYLLKKYKKYE